MESNKSKQQSFSATYLFFHIHVHQLHKILEFILFANMIASSRVLGDGSVIEEGFSFVTDREESFRSGGTFQHTHVRTAGIRKASRIPTSRTTVDLDHMV